MGRKLVVLTIEFSLQGGTNRVIADLIPVLMKDAEVSVIALEGEGNAYALPDGVCFRSLRRRRAATPARRAMSSLTELPLLARVLQQQDPDVVISFLPRANVVNVLVKILTRRRYRSIVCERNFNAAQYAQGLAPRSFRFLMRLTYPLADIVIANAQALGDSLVRDFSVPRGKIRVIYNPFDLDRIRRLAEDNGADHWYADARPVILNVARLEPHKNHALLLRAFARVRHHYPCRLLLAGKGTLTDALQRVATSLAVGDDVFFLGWQANPYRLMRHARMLVLSSDFEGFPNVLVEGMACGCPVISTDCPSGPREITADGTCGLLVPAGDEVALAKAIERVLCDAGLAAELSRLGRARAEEFRLDRIGHQFESALRG